MPSTTNRASTGWRSKRPRRGRSSVREARERRVRPADVRPTGFVVTRPPSVAADSTAAASRNRTSRGPSRRRDTVRCATRASSTPTVGAWRRSGTPSSAGSVRRPCRSAPRSTSVPGAGAEIEIETVSGSTTRSAFRGFSPNLWSSRFASSAAARGRADRRGRSLCALPIPAWRSSRSPGPAASATSSAAVEQRPRPEVAPGHTLFAARADQADRAGDAAPSPRQHGGSGLVARHAADVDAGDRRPRGDRPPLEQRQAAEGCRHEHDDADERPRRRRRARGARLRAGLDDGRKRSGTRLNLAEAP